MKFLSRLLALASFSVLAVATAVMPPASAAPQEQQWTITSYATGGCLAADFSNTYTYGCGVANQKWLLESPLPGYYRMISVATGRCLANNDYFTVRTVTCGTTGRSELWQFIGDGSTVGVYIINLNTDRYLSTDFSRAVYLALQTPNQTWTVVA